jgi:hypothetical protein
MSNTIRYELVGVRSDETDVVLSTDLLTFSMAEMHRQQLIASGEAAKFKTLIIRSLLRSCEPPTPFV